MVQDSDFDTVTQLNTTSPFVAVSYICKPRFTSNILKLQYCQIKQLQSLWKKCISFPSLCNCKLLSRDEKQTIFKLSNACYFKACVSYKKCPPKLFAQLSCKFPLVILLLLCCFSHLFRYIYSPKRAEEVNELSEKSSVCLRLDVMNPNMWHVAYCSSKGSLNLHLEITRFSHIFKHSPHFNYKEFTTPLSEPHSVFQVLKCISFPLQRNISNTVNETSLNTYYTVSKSILAGIIILKHFCNTTRCRYLYMHAHRDSI